MGHRILLAEDSRTQALRTRLMLEELGFDVEIAGDGAEALELARLHRPDAILSDILMPNMDGFQLCHEIRRDPDLADTPFVLHTSSFHGAEDRSFGVKVGANDFVEKDCGPEVLSAALTYAIHKQSQKVDGGITEGLDEKAFRGEYGERLVSRLLEEAAEREQAHQALAAAYNATLIALVGALDLRDTETELHSWRVTEYARLIAERLGCGVDFMLALERGSMLHDIGKIGVPDHILRKPGPLDDHEWDEMRKHPRYGYNMVREIDFLGEAKDIVLCHHERWDGGGYPLGLGGETIPLGARIFAAADTIDAVTSDRPYRRGRPFEVALEELPAKAGTQFDPHVVDVALTVGADDWRARMEAVHERRGAKAPLAGA